MKDLFVFTCARLGEKDQALAMLIKEENTSRHLLSYGELRLCPYLDNLRGDPRFEKLVASLAPKGN